MKVKEFLRILFKKYMEIKPDSPVLPEGVTARFTDHNSLAGLLRDGENLIRGTVDDEGFLKRYRKYLNKKASRPSRPSTE
jgi:hypothetical protein